MPPLIPLIAVVAAIVGHPVPLGCVSGQTLGTTVTTPDGTTYVLEPHALGEAFIGTGAIFVDEDVCESYVGLGSMAPGAALLVAVHEAEHVRYRDPDEARTECRALRDFFPAAMWALRDGGGRFASREPVPMLPDGGGQVVALAAELYVQALTFSAGLPPTYHGGDC